MFAEAASAAQAHRAPARRKPRKRSQSLARWLREHPPRFIATCARGSSDQRRDVRQVSVSKRSWDWSPPRPRLRCLGVCGQSRNCRTRCSSPFRSPDEPRPVAQHRIWRARPVRGSSRWSTTKTRRWRSSRDYVIPLRAGRETQRGGDQELFVFARRRCCSWRQNGADDEALSSALHALPEALRQAWTMDWSPLVDGLRRRARACSWSGAVRASPPRRKPRSSSRKPAACTPKLSARGSEARADGDRRRGLSGAVFVQDDTAAKARWLLPGVSPSAAPWYGVAQPGVDGAGHVAIAAHLRIRHARRF